MPTLFEQVKSDVRGQIARGEWAVGEVLPPVESLAARIGCSVGTVRRAISELATAGLVQPVQKRGTVVRRRPALGRVVLMLSGEPHMDLLLQEPLYSALVEAGFHVDLLPGKLAARDFETHLARLDAGDPVDLALVIEPERLDPAVKQLMERKFRHRVAFGCHPTAVREPYTTVIGPDLVWMARGVVEHLWQLGHRRIAVVSGFQGERQSWAAVSAQHARHFIEVAGGVYFDLPLGTGYAERLRQMTEHDGVTACWALNDHEALQTVMHLLLAGRKVPREVSIVGRYDTPWSHGGPVPLTSVSLAPEQTGQAVARIFSELLAGRMPDAVTLIQPTLVARASTAAPPSDVTHSSGRS